MVTGAVTHAPSVHNTQPWFLQMHGHTASLYERLDAALVEQDPRGRDRHVSCGAALANLVLAVRVSGWETELLLEPDPQRRDLLATVTGCQPRQPTVIETRRYRAIGQRTSYRRAFASRKLPSAVRQQLRAAATSTVVQARWVRSDEEAVALARLLAYSANVHRRDPYYQRELSMWLIERGTEHPDVGVWPDRLGTQGVPAAGLATGQTRVPDEHRLASEIEQESVLALWTPSDGRRAHLQTGDAMQRAWLEATSVGIATSVMTQPLHLPEVRSGLADAVGLPGSPHVLMRFGYPATTVSPAGRHARAEMSPLSR